MSTPELYIGIMCGTSLDGLDLVLVDCAPERPQLLHSHFEALPHAIEKRLRALITECVDAPIRLFGELHQQIGECSAAAVLRLLHQSQTAPQDIIAIGSHGITIWHQPEQPHPFSLQLGDPAVIAARTEITTVADFRSMDIACGGQGAPLTPLFHTIMKPSGSDEVGILNIGGIANLTLLPNAHTTLTGADTGPGNGLMDAWINARRGLPYDDGGGWAAQGRVIPELLQQLSSHDFFSHPPPRSTGRETFNLAWLETFLHPEYRPQDVQCTLLELSVFGVVSLLQQLKRSPNLIAICGGGAHNQVLMSRLSERLNTTVVPTSELGYNPDWVEAIAFAWLAHQRMTAQRCDTRPVTGSTRDLLLGSVWQP